VLFRSAETMNLLQTAVSPSDNHLALTHTWVDAFFASTFGDGLKGDKQLNRVIVVAFFGILMLCGLIMIVTVVSTIFTSQSSNFPKVPGNRGLISKKGVSFAFFIAWLAIGSFLIFCALHIIVINGMIEFLANQLGNIMKGSAADFSIFPFTDMIQTAHATLVKAHKKIQEHSKATSEATGQQSLLSTLISSAMQATSSLSGSATTNWNLQRQITNVCARAWNEDSMVANFYPPGSVVYDHNLQRLNEFSGSDLPDLDHARQLLTHTLATDYHGVPTELSRAFGMISNVCEEEGGNIEKCCDESRCQTNAEPEACFMRRCPGKVLFTGGSGGNCKCVDTLAKLGYPTSPELASMCLADTTNWGIQSGSSLINSGKPSLGSTVTNQACSGTVFDISKVYVSGLVRQMYGFSNFTDAYLFESQSMFARPHPEAPLSSSSVITFTVRNCESKILYLSIRYLNQDDTEKSIQVQIDNISVSEIPIPRRGESSVWSTVVDVPIAGVLRGTHSISLKAATGYFPYIHKIAISQKA